MKYCTSDACMNDKAWWVTEWQGMMGKYKYPLLSWGLILSPLADKPFRSREKSSLINQASNISHHCSFLREINVIFFQKQIDQHLTLVHFSRSLWWMLGESTKQNSDGWPEAKSRQYLHHLSMLFIFIINIVFSTCRLCFLQSVFV